MAKKTIKKETVKEEKKQVTEEMVVKTLEQEMAKENFTELKTVTKPSIIPLPVTKEVDFMDICDEMTRKPLEI